MTPARPADERARFGLGQTARALALALALGVAGPGCADAQNPGYTPGNGIQDKDIQGEETMTLGPAPRLDGRNHWAGAQAAADAAAELVIRDASAWRALWLDRVGRMPPGELPAGAMAVAVFLGQRSTGGYGVEIDAPRPTEAGLAVPYRIARPGPNEVVITAITHPWAIRLVPETEAAVRFREQ